MKTWKLFLGAFGLLSLASCSNDELTSVNRDGDEIAFNVISNSHTRSEKIYDSNNKPTSFNVCSTYTKGNVSKAYFTNDEFELSDGIWKNKGNTRYWPNDGATLDFFAYVNATTEDNNYKFDWNNGSPAIEVTVPTSMSDQKDLLYAVKTGQTKPENTTTVDLNFRHALSQIVFKAKNTNSKLFVKISEVSVCKLANKNTFNFPTQSTDASATETSKYGTWETLTTKGSQTYTATLETAVEVPGDNNAKDLTSNNSAQAMLLLPQETTAWNTITKLENQEDSYFLVKCQIYNVAGDNYDKDTDVCLWGENEAKDVAIPVSINWEQGKKYIYTFVFGEGNGGYDPEGPEGVLLPITFNVTVDDFTEVEEEIKMDKPTTTTTD